MGTPLSRSVTVIALAVLSGLGAFAQEPCTITVQPGQSIQEVISEAPEGAAICLASGDWQEHLDIGKSVTLRGVGSTQVIGRNAGVPVIHIQNPGEKEIFVTLAGLTVTGGTGDGGGLLIQGTARVTIINCAFVANETGIGVLDSARATITDCTVLENKFGIQLWGSSQATITNSTVSGSTDYGIVLVNSARATLTGCILHNNEFGVCISHSSQATITGCTVLGNKYGIAVLGWTQTAITSCSVLENEYGILIGESAKTTINTNMILGSRTYGISLWAPPCDGGPVYAGLVIGGGNRIRGAVCPETLGFLMTEEGGELDKRPTP
jgi:parallel beta-helix repeat protein